MSFSVKHSNGINEAYDTYEEAVAALVSVYGTPEIGHPGDISEGGETTLVWGSAELALDDDGARACAKIQVRHEVESI